MSRIAALIACWVALGLERGLAGLVQIELGSLTVAPSIVAPVLVFFCIHATQQSALWTCLITGVALDLAWSPSSSTNEPGVVLGMYAFGFTLSAWFVLLSRGVVIKKNPITLCVLSVAFVMIAQTWISLVMGLRSVYDTVLWDTGLEWTSRMAGAGLTGLVAIAWWLVLTPIMGVFGFHQPLSRYGAGRAH